MTAKLAEADQMTVEEFLAFYDSQPNGERWELIEGIAIMSPAPTQWHQRIASNIIGALDAAKITDGASWTAMMGVGTKVPVSPKSLPQPDVYVQQGAPEDTATTDDAIVIFEVLSKSNSKTDQAWRKRVYASVPNCQHYVTISQKTQEIVRYDREDGWQAHSSIGPDAVLSLPAIDVTIPLSTIYRWTPIK